MDWKTQCGKDVNSPHTDYKFNAISIKIPARSFIDIDKVVLKSIWGGN